MLNPAMGNRSMACSSAPSSSRRVSFGSLTWFLFLCLLVGFIAGELMGGILVARSNRDLLREQEWLEKAGYIAVPGTALRSQIRSLKTYAAGGLFFSLSVGLCYAFLWGIPFWVLAPRPKIRTILLMAVVVPALILYIISSGWRGMWPFGLFLMAVPVLIHCVCSRGRFPARGRHRMTEVMPYVTGLVGTVTVVYMLFNPTLTGHDFVRLRDGVFGRSAVGRGIVDFYYRYTLYPARVIKTFDQKLQRVLRVDREGFTEKELKRIEQILAWRDIYIGENAPADARIKKIAADGELCVLSRHRRVCIQKDLHAFIKDPDILLKEYNDDADRAFVLRRAVRVSLFQVWPLMGIFFLFTLLVLLAGLPFSNPGPTRDALAAFLLFLLLLIGLSAIVGPKRAACDTEGLVSIIAGKAPGDKITAAIALWECIEHDRKQARLYSGHFIAMLNDPHPVVRKWGIDLLALTEGREGIDDLIPLLHDPNPDVAYHAARSLGKMKAMQARDQLLEIVTSTREWYLKTTAYIALREIGWSQSPSKRGILPRPFP
ncbi:MAG: HEAT repeat domain-containing protein [bacterium]